MANLFIGAGQAGCNIVNQVFDEDDLAETDLASALAVNSTVEDMRQLDNVARDRWYVVGNDGEMLRGDTAGLEGRAKRGFGSRPRNSDRMAGDSHDEIRAMLDSYMDDHTLDGAINHAIICVGLGGGTGCGYAPHLAEVVRDYDDSLTEIVAVGVLPDTSGGLGGLDDSDEGNTQRSWNTVFGLKRLEPVVDGIILVDNQRRIVTESPQDFTDYNRYIGSALADLVSPTSLSIDPSEYESAALTIELADVVNAVTEPGEVGETGYAALGWAGATTRSLLGYLLPFYRGKAIDEQELALEAIERRSLADVNPGQARKALGLIRAPGSHVENGSRGVNAEAFKTFLQTLCPEAIVGQTLTNRNVVSFASLLTYRRDDISRVSQLFEQAQQYESISWT
jgi:cell division GTPase FtsZ